MRVEEIASVFSGASSGAKPTGGHSTTWRKHKEHHEYVVKRSLQRARRRALLGGTTMYRGRLYTSAELGLPGTPYLPSQLTVGSRRALQARDKVDLIIFWRHGLRSVVLLRRNKPGLFVLGSWVFSQ